MTDTSLTTVAGTGEGRHGFRLSKAFPPDIDREIEVRRENGWSLLITVPLTIESHERHPIDSRLRHAPARQGVQVSAKPGSSP